MPTTDPSQEQLEREVVADFIEFALHDLRHVGTLLWLIASEGRRQSPQRAPSCRCRMRQ